MMMMMETKKERKDSTSNLCVVAIGMKPINEM